MKETTTILMILFSLAIFATEQTPDVLIHKSDTIYLETYPFEVLMDSDSLIRQKVFGDGEEFCISSGCWRGHVATWKIENDSLFLIDLIDGCEGVEFKLEEFFHYKKIDEKKVFADWFTGELVESKSEFDFIFINDSIQQEKRFNISITEGQLK